MNSFYAFFSLTLNVNKNVIEVHYDKDIKLFRQDVVDVIMESDQCISQSKKHYLVLEVAITSSKTRLFFIVFFDTHLVVGISLIELGELSSST